MCLMRAWVAHAEQVSKFESCFPRSYERGLRRAPLWGAVNPALDGDASMPFSVADTLVQRE